ncbi:MAG: ATP-binding protein [Candidatus Zixiibacteriota bacterium]
MEKQVKSSYQLKVDISSLYNEQERKQKEIIQLKKKKNVIITELDKYHNLNFNPDQFISLNDKLEKLEKTAIQYNQLKGSLNRLPVLTETLIKLESKNEKVSKKITQLQEEMKSINYKEKYFEQIKISFSDINNNFEDVKSKFQSLSKEKELLEKELDGKLEQLKSLEKKAFELEELRVSQYHLEKLGQLFSEFRKDLITSIRPTLAEISSRLFSEMTDSKYNLVELDDKYNLRVMDEGIYFGVDRFSGGEKDLANLCLRMAISLALTESAGMRRSFVILDEVFGSQDNQRKELILKALGRLKQRFPQILLVTHIEDIKDGVEEVIEVLPTGNGWSEVVVNGSRF